MRLRHRAAVITAVAGIALTGLSVAGPAFAAAAAPGSSVSASAPAKALSLSGTISAVNASKSLLTVTSGDGANVTVNVDPKASVTLDGNTAALAKLPVGGVVKLNGTVSNGANVATSVSATTVLPFVSVGTVAAVDAGAQTVSVKRLSLDGKGTTVTYPVAAKAAISLDGRSVALSAVPARAYVLVTGTVTGGTTYAVKSLTAMSRWALNLNGTVNAVDAAAETVTVNSSNTAVKLNVDPKATIQLNGAKVALGSLPVGANVALTGTDSTVGATVSGINATLSGSRTR
jgi:hypothetical protein